MEIDDWPWMENEWGSWLALCDELKALGIEINEHDRLAHLIEAWGEELVQLRLRQPEDLIARVLEEKRRLAED